MVGRSASPLSRPPSSGRSRSCRPGSWLGTATITNNIAEIKVDQGHYAEATEQFKEVHSICEAAGYRMMVNVANSNLARVEARSGQLDAAVARLEEALTNFNDMGAASWVLETEARLAECSLLARNYAEALRRASETLAHALVGGSPVLQAALHRIRGYALLQALDARGAEESFEESLRCAEATGAEYELALTLQAKARLAALRGEPAAEDEERSRAIFERLGVISTPEIPLPR
jgi:tetratricopeptide (TPR) repeat protein